jgi:hypothetical protein
MDGEGFREFLRKRKLDDKQIEGSIATAQRFEQYWLASDNVPAPELVWRFTNILIQEGSNSYENLLALARYGLFIKNNEIYIAFIELLDGAEAQPNLYKKVGELFGSGLRDAVFSGIGISPMGLPTPEKPFDMFPVLDRLVSTVGNETVEHLLSACLRDLPEEYFIDEREMFTKSSDIDAYLKEKHTSFVEQLEKCQDEGALFFAQEITKQVVDYVRDRPETECGVREGNDIYITKIPYNTKQYLVETDPTLKRYYACHCPWAREAIKNGSIHLDPIFCNCSAGFSKKPWEVIFGQPLEVKMLESAINGDFRCRFVVRLPEELEFGSQ